MQGESKRRTEGKLGAVNLAFLDEIMKASDPTVNMLLSVLNERRIEGQETPLWSVGSATNWPEVHAMKPTVAAFWDRLHIRIIVEEVTQAAAVKELLNRGRLLAKTPYVSQTKITLDEIKSCKQVIRDVQIPDIIEDLLVSISARLADQKVFISSRRLVQFQFILQAHAWMDGRDVVNVTDFNRLTWCCWTKKDDISKITSVLSTCDAALVQSLNETINAARKMYADYSRIGMTQDRAQEFIVFASDVAIRVADIVGAKNLTVTSKKDVIRALKLLKYEVEQVILKHGETLGL
jgi:MoxR-like ATPase